MQEDRDIGSPYVRHDRSARASRSRHISLRIGSSKGRRIKTRSLCAHETRASNEMTRRTPDIADSKILQNEIGRSDTVRHVAPCSIRV